jgi:hypothetical protein
MEMERRFRPTSISHLDKLALGLANRREAKEIFWKSERGSNRIEHVRRQGGERRDSRDREPLLFINDCWA